jgi:uncharacterized membrane protein YhiD involved in acid resistance
MSDLWDAIGIGVGLFLIMVLGALGLLVVEWIVRSVQLRVMRHRKAFEEAHLTVAEKLEPKSARRRPAPPMGQHVDAATDADAAEQIARGLWR